MMVSVSLIHTALWLSDAVLTLLMNPSIVNRFSAPIVFASLDENIKFGPSSITIENGVPLACVHLSAVVRV